MKLYFVRTQGGKLLPQFLQSNIIALGYNELGDFNKYDNEKVIKSSLLKAYPNFSEREISNAIGNIFRFVREIKVGDYVITFDKLLKCYHVGIVRSKNLYTDKYIGFSNIRKSLWISNIPKKSLSSQTNYKLGGLTPVYKVNEVAEKEIFKKLKIRN